MTSMGWPLVEVVARLLESDERDAVLGDLQEASETTWHGLFGVLALVFRRQTELWKSWRPWLAGFGVAFPSSLLLMGASLTVSWSYQRLLCPELLAKASLTPRSGFLLLLCQALVLTGWSWTGGFVVGTVSRRTLWASTVLCYAPCLFCLTRFRVDSLSRFCLLLFLLPAIWGVRQGLRISMIKRSWAIVLALAVTVLTIPAWSSGHQHWWTLNWALSLPAWYLAATSWKSARAAAHT
jgi:hypothetical protein